MLRELEGLRALARSLVRGDAEADDLIQDAAVAALVHPPETGRPVRPWLAMVIRNRWRMNRRGDARRLGREQAVALDEVVEVMDDPVDRARAFERLGAALVALDEPFKSTVIRRYLDGETAAEIARAVGVPAGTVRWRLKIGLERLRAALDASTPRWSCALAPFAFGKGALLVKAKTWLVSAVVLLLLVGATAFSLTRHLSPRSPPIAAVVPPKTGNVTPGGVGAISTSPRTQTQGSHDPLPGQGRPILEDSAAAGGILAGRVINWSTGDGVPNAELTFTADAGAVTVRTHDDGVFELAPPAPDRFMLSAVASPGFLPYAPELAHSTVRVELAAGRAVRGITVFLFPAVDYHGRVLDLRGTPIAGARVRLLGTPTGEQAIEKLATEWSSDSTGAFTFHAADGAVLEATLGTARGWARLDDKVAITKQLVIEVGEAPARDATIRGTTIDPTGAPIADVLVRAEPERPMAAAEPERPPSAADTRATAFATSAADGSFALEGLDRGRYRVAAEIDGHAPAVQPQVAGGTRNVKLVLDGGLPIAGTVVTSDGNPVPAYTLLVMLRKGAARELVVARSIVDPRGRFDVRVAAGDYELVASATGWAPSPPAPVSAGTRDAKLVVTVGATLRGIVIDAADKSPLRYARVMREASGGGATPLPANAGTVTRADGSFELAGIPPGPVSITVGAGDYHPRVEAGLTAVDGAVLGPIVVPLTKVLEGEQPTLELVGIGCKLSARGEGLTADMVFPDSGAAAAGIVAGDVITAVDGMSVATIGLDGAISRIRGTAGTTVVITLARDTGPISLVVMRKKLRGV